jgi:sodium-dependent phosphate transporter
LWRSTTHASVGATVGVGMLEGRRGVNWRILIKFVAGWIATLVVTVGTTAAFTAQVSQGATWVEVGL